MKIVSTLHFDSGTDFYTFIIKPDTVSRVDESHIGWSRSIDTAISESLTSFIFKRQNQFIPLSGFTEEKLALQELLFEEEFEIKFEYFSAINPSNTHNKILKRIEDEIPEYFL